MNSNNSKEFPVGFNMDENIICKYARLMRELGLSALEISQDGFSLRLERDSAGTASAPAGSPAVTAENAPAQNTIREFAHTDITSPMIGVFYTSPSEDSEPFVKPGTSVKRGDVICIIEAMKLMNEITAEKDGIITEICAENGQIVDFGHLLFRMKETGK